MLVGTICVASFLVGCDDDLPPFPTVRISLIDSTYGKLHNYELPKQRGVDAPYLGSTNLTYAVINKHYSISPNEWSKVEGYISRLEDAIKKKCR